LHFPRFFEHLSYPLGDQASRLALKAALRNRLDRETDLVTLLHDLGGVGGAWPGLSAGPQGGGGDVLQLVAGDEAEGLDGLLDAPAAGAGDAVAGGREVALAGDEGVAAGEGDWVEEDAVGRGLELGGLLAVHVTADTAGPASKHVGQFNLQEQSTDFLHYILYYEDPQPNLKGIMTFSVNISH
jgi:hypothetical protein